ncbi:hypothetical protein RCL1_000928 [Eukaryota sp. TZLM3-RCL]
MLSNVWVFLLHLVFILQVFSIVLTEPPVASLPSLDTFFNHLTVVQDPFNFLAVFFDVSPLAFFSLCLAALLFLTLVLLLGYLNVHIPIPVLYVFSPMYTFLPTVLLFPMTSMFFYYATCQFAGDLCFEGTNLFYFILSIFSLLLLSLLSLLSTFTHFHFDYKSGFFFARCRSTIMLAYIFFVFFHSVLTKFFPLMITHRYFFLIIIFYFNSKHLVLSQPFYSTFANDLFSGIFAFNLVVAVFLYFAFVLSYQSFPMLYVLASPSFLIGYLSSLFFRRKLVFPSTILSNYLRFEHEAAQISMVDDRNSEVGDLPSVSSLASIFNESNVLATPSALPLVPKTVPKVVFSSESQVELNLRFLKNSFKESMDNRYKLYKKRDFYLDNLLPPSLETSANFELQSFSIDPSFDLRNKLASEIIRIGSEQFPDSELIPLKASFIALQYQLNPSLAFSYLQRIKRSCSKSLLNGFEYFICFKLRETATNAHGAGEISGDVVAEFNRMFRSARRRTIDCQRAIYAFWSLLLEDVPDTESLLAQMRKFSSTETKADAAYEILISKFPNNPQALRAYALYLSDIKKEEFSSKIYLQRAEEIDEAQKKRISLGQASDKGGSTVYTATNTDATFSQKVIDEANSKVKSKPLTVRKNSNRFLFLLSLISISFIAVTFVLSSSLKNHVEILTQQSEILALSPRLLSLSRRYAMEISNQNFNFTSGQSEFGIFPTVDFPLSSRDELFSTIDTIRSLSSLSFHHSVNELGSKSVWKSRDFLFFDYVINTDSEMVPLVRKYHYLDAINHYLLSSIMIYQSKSHVEFNLDQAQSSRPLRILFDNLPSLMEFGLKSIDELIDLFSSMRRVTSLQLLVIMLSAILFSSFLAIFVFKTQIQQVFHQKQRTLKIFYAIPKTFVARLARSLNADSESSEDEAPESGDDISDSELNQVENKGQNQPNSAKTESKKSKKHHHTSSKPVLVKVNHNDEAKVIRKKTIKYSLASIILGLGFVFVYLWILIAIFNERGATIYESKLISQQISLSERLIQSSFELYLVSSTHDSSFQLNSTLIKDSINSMKISLDSTWSSLKFGSKYSNGMLKRSNRVDHLLFLTDCFDLSGPIDCPSNQSFSLDYFLSTGIDDVISIFFDRLSEVVHEEDTEIQAQKLENLMFIFESSVFPGLKLLSNLIVDDLYTNLFWINVAAIIGSITNLLLILTVKSLLLNPLITSLEKESRDTTQLLLTIPDSVINAVPTVKALLNSDEEFTDQDAESLLADNQQRTDSILSLSSDAIVTADEVGVIDSFNRAAEEMFGYSAAEIIGENVKLLMPSNHAVVHHNYMNNYITTGIKKVIGRPRNVPAVRKDGSTFAARLSLTEMNLSGKRNFCAFIRDMTSFVEIENELAKVKEIQQILSLNFGVDYFVIDKETKNLVQLSDGFKAIQQEDLIGQQISSLIPFLSNVELSEIKEKTSLVTCSGITLNIVKVHPSETLIVLFFDVEEENLQVNREVFSDSDSD